MLGRSELPGKETNRLRSFQGQEAVADCFGLRPSVNWNVVLLGRKYWSRRRRRQRRVVRRARR